MNTSKPKYKVSIITCSLSDFEGLSRTLLSIDELIGDEIESILVLSKYSSSEISQLRSISFLRDCKIIEQEPEGIYSAMNKGLSQADSEFCMFLNGGDEFCDPQAFINFVNGLTSQEWAFSPIYIANDHNDTCRKYVFNPYSPLKHRLSLKFVPHPGTLYRTGILKLMGGFNTSFSVAADQELAMKFGQRSHPRIGDIPFVIFYSGGTSTRCQDEITNDFKLISRQVFGNFFRLEFLDSLIWGLVRHARKLSEKFNSLK